MPPKTPQNSFEHLQLANAKNDGWKITFLFGKAFFQGRTCCEFTANLSSNMCRRVDQLPSLYQPHSVGGLYTHYKDSLKFPFIPRWDDHAPWYFRPLLQDRGSYTNTPVSCPSPMEIERSDCGSTKHEFHPSIHPSIRRPPQEGARNHCIQTLGRWNTRTHRSCSRSGESQQHPGAAESAWGFVSKRTSNIYSLNI